MEEKALKRKRFGKRNIALTVVLLFICAAVYLNWSYNNKWDNADDAMSAAEEGIREDDLGVGAAEPGEETESGGAAGLIGDYFASARLSRQSSRDEALGLLETAVSAETASQEVIDAAMSAITAMATWSMLETQIENQILAKGYADCVVYLADAGVTVAVPAPVEGLTEADVARVTETIVSESDYSVEQITVIEVRN